MELTGKCKELFEEWYYKYLLNQKDGCYYDMDYFTDSMKYGIYVDFFWWVEGELVCISENAQLDIYNGVISIEEARVQAIQKANELINNKQ